MFRKLNITKIIVLVSTIFVIPTLNIYGYEEDSITFSNRDDGSYKIYSSEDEITLQNLIIKFKKSGYYKIHVEDMDGNESDIKINVNEDGSKNSHGSADTNLGSSYNETLEITTSPINPKTYEWVNLIARTDKNYTGKINFSKLQYRASASAAWSDISRTGSVYISDYSDEWDEGYYNLSPSDKGEVILEDLIKFKKSGYYRLYVEDTNGNKRYQQLTVDTGGNENTEDLENFINNLLNKTGDNNYETYESRSCELYKIEFNNELSAYTSPNLKTIEYFINPEYFKRYIDSKNTENKACYSGNRTWISYPYVDNYTGTDRIVAPNGKIYFINEEDGGYTSNQLKAGNKFSSFDELKQYINQFNPLTEMNL